MDTLLQLRVADLKDEIQRVSNTATQEASLEELLRKVQNSWVGTAWTSIADASVCVRINPPPRLSTTLVYTTHILAS